MPVLPLAFYPVVEVFLRASSRVWLCALLALLTVASATHALLSISVTPFFPTALDYPLVQVALRSLWSGVAAPNLASEATELPRMMFVGLLAIVILAAVAVSLGQLIELRSRAVTLAVVVAGACCIVALHLLVAPRPSEAEVQIRLEVAQRVGHLQPGEP